MNEIHDVLNGAQGAKVTAKKANLAMDQGYKITGLVLCNPEGERLVIELGAARRFDKNLFWDLMHPQHGQ